MFFRLGVERGTANPLWRGLIWQIILALVTLAVVVIAPVKMQRRLLILTVAQFILLAGVGHATMRDGVVGTLQQINHALHLLCAAAWFGGLLPVVYCMRMAQGRWRQHAISAMMRFSRYGHFLWRAYCSQALATRYLSRDLPLSGRPPMDSCFC